MSDIIGHDEPLVKIACNNCKHYHRKKNMTKFSCKAFANIPDSILLGKNQHSTPLQNQGNDIVFEPKKK